MELTNYETLLGHARNYYQSAAIRQEADAEASLGKFFNEAFREVVKPGKRPKVIDFATKKVTDNGGEVLERFNPSVARMALQQGQCDVLAGCLIARNEGQIDDNAFKMLQRNIVKATQKAHRSNNGRYLFAITKETFPKSYLKRIAIGQCLRDGALIMLENNAEGKTAATVNSFGEDLGLACTKELKGVKKFELAVLKVSSVLDKIIFAPIKGYKGLMKLIRR